MSWLPGRDEVGVTFDRLLLEYKKVYHIMGMEPSIEEIGDFKAAADTALLCSKSKIRYSQFGHQILYPLKEDYSGIAAFKNLEAKMEGLLLRVCKDSRSLILVLPDRADPKRVVTPGKTHGLANGTLELYDQDVVPTYARLEQYTSTGDVHVGPLAFSGVNHGETYVWFGMESFHVPTGVANSQGMRYNCWIQSAHLVSPNDAFFDYVYGLAVPKE